MANSLAGDAPDGELLDRALATGRVHSAYLVTGPAERTRALAERFVRALVCSAPPGERPCGACAECRRSGRIDEEPVEIDGTGKRGALFRHVGDHPDLLWVERGASDTRVRIGQVRALQHALRLAANEGGWRAAVLADAEWLNQEAQNALLRLLEEPPERTCLLLVSANASGLLATIRSRCQRVRVPVPPPPGLRDADAPDDQRAVVGRLDAIERAGLPELLDWAEEYRGDRASAAARVHGLLATGSAWLRERVRASVERGDPAVRPELDACRALSRCRKELDQRNANPQMVAERALIAIREAVA